MSEKSKRPQFGKEGKMEEEDSLYEQVKKLIEEGNTTEVEEKLNLLKKQGKEVDIPSDYYKKEALRFIGTDNPDQAEKIIALAKQQGKEVELEDKSAVAGYLGVIHSKELGHVERIREKALEKAKELGMTYEKAINVNWADYLDVPEDRRIDISIDEKDHQILFQGIMGKDGNAQGKYIVVKDENGPTKLIFDNTLGEHKDIIFKDDLEEDHVEDGGWINFDKENKRIEVYGGSKFFGQKDKEKTLQLLEESFEDYEVIER